MNADSEPRLPLISIVIINFNGRVHIERCLSSVLASNYPCFEVIFVDNASTDDSLELLQPFLSNVTLVRNPANFLSSKGLNQGIRHSRGEIVVLLDLDTEVQRDWLSQLILPLLENPLVAITGSKLLFGDGKTIQHAGGTIRRNGCTAHFGHGEQDQGQWDQTRQTPYVTGAALAIRQSVLKELGGGLDELFPFYFEEVDLCWHARRLGYQVVYVAESVAIHHESTSWGGSRSERYYFHYHRGRWRFILKNMPWREIATNVIPEELRWLWKYAHADHQWRVLPRAYFWAFVTIPQIIQRRMGRRRCDQARAAISARAGEHR